MVPKRPASFERVIEGRVMAHIMSIDWDVEDFRRLISEETLSTAKTVDVVSFEIAPASETREELPDAEIGLPKTNDDLHDPNFIDEAAAVEPKEVSTPEVNDAVLEIVNHEVVDSGPSKSLDKIAKPFVLADDTAAFVVPNGSTSEVHLEASTPETTEQLSALEASETPITRPDPAPPALYSDDETLKSPPYLNATEGLDIPAGDPTHETTNTLYRGIELSTTRCAAGGRWRWSVLVGRPAMLRMGEAASEYQAELNARSVIDRAIAIEETLQRLKSSDRADA